MYIKNRFLKILFKTAVIFAVFECAYLFALPPVLNHFLSYESIQNTVQNNTNANINYSKLRLKTNVKPDITVLADKLTITDKENSYKFIDADKLKVRISILDLLRKKINIKEISSDDIDLYAFQNKDGIFNFEELFNKSENSVFKIKIKNNSINLNRYKFSFEDKILNKSFIVQGEPLKAEIKNKKRIYLNTKGQTVNNENSSDFDIDISTDLPLSKTISPDSISGKCFIYNIDLDVIEPYFKKFIDKNTSKLSGIIEYLQISSNKTKDGKLVSINTLLKDVQYNRNDWTNDAHINGEANINASVEPQKNKIHVKSVQVKSDNVDVKAYGNIDFNGEKPYLDIDAVVNKSKAEDIFAMLPQNITKSIGTIERVKYYGVYGDVEAKGNVKGYVPQPDITGYIKGRSLHALDKSIHHLHNADVDINFDKRILNMDITVNLFGNQRAKINGYTYMYRDGVNNVTIKTTDNIDFPLAQKLIIPISKVFNFMLGPIVDMDITSGKGIINLNVQGSMDFIAMNGYSEFHNAALTYNGLHGKVHNGAGRLDFKDDVISFKSKQAYVKTNPFSVNGYVKINDHLDFDIKANNADGVDVLEIINNSSLLKDVKAGLALFTSASGRLNLDTNIKAKIVPVPFGHPPLPPEEAFEDMRVKGTVNLLGDSCYIEGFKTPIYNIKGDVDFTETDVDIHPLSAMSGSSNITISGKVINDLKTKVPDVDVTVTSDSVNLKDTVKFLVESYLYPDFYPDLSSLYNIASKHDLYFRYKAKSIDFLTDKAYAVMNFIQDDTDNPIKAKSGRIIMDKAVVTVDNIDADLFNASLFINGKVKNVDTVNPIYDLDIKAENFNLENLNDTSKITIMPEQMSEIFALFKDYNGFADIDIALVKNILTGNVNLKSPKFVHCQTGIPFNFDDFAIIFKNNKILFENVAANIADMPFFGNFTISDYYQNPNIDAFFTSKITNNFVKTYLNSKIAEKLSLKGDINFTSKISGTAENLKIKPKLVLNPDSDIIYDGTNIGDINEKREFSGSVKLNENNIKISNLDYIKYISSQNNKTYPIKFMTVSGLFKTMEKEIIPEEIKIKTYKNIPARFLNIMLKSPILKQGSFNGEAEYIVNPDTKEPKIIGDINFGNIDIPLYDTVIKHIKIDTDEENNINLSLFGFLFDEKVSIKAQVKNDLSDKPEIKSLSIFADKIDKNKLFEIMSKTHLAMNTNNQIKNVDLNGLSIKNGHIEIKELIVKELTADNFNADFSIDENGIFSAEDISANIGQGNVNGTISYNLYTTDITGNFELTDVDSNYAAEALFDGKNQIYGNASGKMYIRTKGISDEERIKNLSGFVYFDIADGRMPKLGSLEYLLRAGNIIKSGITGFTINSVLELLNLVKTGYFSNINGTCTIESGIAKDIEIFSTGENLSLYLHGEYDIAKTSANMEVLGKLSKHISTIFGAIGNTSLNTFFKLIPGISLFDFGRKNFVEDVEKIPSFTNGDYDSRIFQAIIDGNINGSGYVQSFKWVK